MRKNNKFKVLFVCLGNICRSPTAHGVFQHKVIQRGLQKYIEVDSCGTGDWHIGHAPDKRSQQKALESGYDLSTLRARQIQPSDFTEYDFLFAMDKSNLSDMQAMQQMQKSTDHNPTVDLFLRFGLADPYDKRYKSQSRRAQELDYEVPDPYYGGDDGFATVLSLIEAASNSLLDYFEKQLVAS